MIGIFDSGIGGLTVLKHIHERLPQYSTIYLGDTAHAPYGTKTHDQITEYTWAGVKWLFGKGCPLVILACNSASSQALRTIQQNLLHEYPGKKVLGVIRPTAEELAGKYRKIGILATPATVSSNAYVNELHHLNPILQITQYACPDWVTLVESGKTYSDEASVIVKRDIEKLLEQDDKIEAVLLGCTHYPHLYDQIRSALPDEIEVYDQGPIVAAQLEDYLKRHPEIEKQLDISGDREYYETKSDSVIEKAEFFV